MVSIKTRPLPEGAPSLHDFLVSVRRRIHRRPELAYEERETGDIVARLVESFGYRVQRAARTGVVADSAAWDGSGLVLTADMDALPIQEEPGRAYGSEIDGVMHACGHDGHTAALLGAAWLLADSARPLRFVFRPAEEGTGDDEHDRTGAELLVEEGVFDGASGVIGFHIDGSRRTGELFIPEGPVMSAIHHFRVVITGARSHGAYPNEGRDPVWMGTYVLNRLYAIRQFDISPRRQAALNIRRANTSTGSGPLLFTIEGSVRTYEPEVLREITSSIERVPALVSALGGEATAEVWEDTPIVFNDHALTHVAREIARREIGPEALARDFAPESGSDDFAFISALGKPTLYFLAGAYHSAERSRHHTPSFDFDEACLDPLARFLALLGEQIAL